MTNLGWFLIALPFFTVAYAYLGYPFILWLITRGKDRVVLLVPTEWPMISIVVPAYNEEGQIGGTIQALLRQDYPVTRRQILILSDASSDRTDEIVSSYADRGVELMRMQVRGGKTAAENEARSRLKGEIVINTDAAVRLAPTAVRLLVEAMVDPAVGVASTRDVSVSNLETVSNVTEAQYVGYEMRLRDRETHAGGIVGASGSGYAIRRELHDIRIPDMLSRDFSAALTARTHGFRAVSVDDSICFVPRTPSLQREYKRKVRTISRGMDTLMFQRHLLDPMQYGSFAWKLWSHKVFRWLVPVSAIPGVIGLLLLAPAYPIAWLGVVAVLLGGLVVLVGSRWPEGKPMPALVSLATFGASANIAVLHAIVRLILGHNDHVWEPTRRAEATSAGPVPIDQIADATV
jgi:cellulose synthase/poly-beta-1,6-N-acetylglucosamine synthase-like glycosyltransferase